MSVRYQAIQWNRQKRRYDMFVAIGIVLYLASFAGLSLWLHPDITAETLLLRATGSLGLIMLHIILMIGPLSRLSFRFLPLLYNRRHLGVTLFLVALLHGAIAILQFHSLGNTPAIVSVFTANTHYDALSRFPFQPLGLFALIILFLLAATSHDFWLKNLGPPAWKGLHMLVYVAYTLLIGHVVLGTLQYEVFTPRFVLLGVGVIAVIGVHVSAAFHERLKRNTPKGEEDGFHYVCDVDDIRIDCAKIVNIGDEEIAVFRYGKYISAVHNLCKHQNGPLGEGRIFDGCITCPWHGYQYIPQNGTSPPPYTEKLKTYRTMVRDGQVLVHPDPMPEGTYVEPARTNHA